MSTDEALPPWARHHRAGFVNLLRALERVPGFILQPLETPSRDLDRVLAAWLTSQGRPTQLVAPSDEDAWKRLAATLTNLPQVEHQVVMVSGAQTIVAGMYHGLAMMNLHRDGIARRLGCPLLWCGGSAFLHATWEQAPDFWSIGAIPKRFAPDASVAWAPPLPAGVARVENRESLQRLYDEAREQGDTENQARVGTRLLMALLAEGQNEAALLLNTTLVKLGRTGMDAYETLQVLANLHTMGGPLEDLQRVYEAILAHAQTVKSLPLEAATLEQLGLLHRDAGRQAEARASLGLAVELFRALGNTDAEATSLIAFLQMKGVEDDAVGLQRHLRRLEHLVESNENPEIRSRAYFVVAQFLSAQERLEEALQMLSRIDGLAPVDAVVGAAVEMNRGRIFARLGDIARARRHLTLALSEYEHLQMGEQAAQVHKMLARLSFDDHDTYR